MASRRTKAVERAFTALLPLAPFLDAHAIRDAASAPHLRALPVETALWLAALAHIRHEHTDYDELRDAGYERDEARFFVLDAVNAVLDRWGSRRRLVSRDEEPPGGAESDASDPSV